MGKKISGLVGLVVGAASFFGGVGCESQSKVEMHSSILQPSSYVLEVDGENFSVEAGEIPGMKFIEIYDQQNPSHHLSGTYTNGDGWSVTIWPNGTLDEDPLAVYFFSPKKLDKIFPSDKR